MKRYFNTKEKANTHLNYRRDCAYKRIKERGDYVLGDASFTYRDHRKKWVVFIQIITKHMMNDLEAAKDHLIPTKALIPFSDKELQEIKERALKELKLHYMKTLEVDNYTTNITQLEEDVPTCNSESIDEFEKRTGHGFWEMKQQGI